MFTEVLTIAVLVSSNQAQAHNPRFAQCKNVLSFEASPHNPVGSNPHPMCIPLGKSLPVKDSQDKSITPASPVIVVNDTVESPVNVPVTVKHEDKPKCNNGEGNGSEGCSPANSEHANNDENNTTPKQDKSK